MGELRIKVSKSSQKTIKNHDYIIIDIRVKKQIVIMTFFKFIY